MFLGRGGIFHHEPMGLFLNIFNQGSVWMVTLRGLWSMTWCLGKNNCEKRHFSMVGIVSDMEPQQVC